MALSTPVNRLLSEIALFHRTSVEKMMDEIGIHGGQVSILSELWEHDGLSQADFVRQLGISPPTVHKLIARLEKGGFIKNAKSPEDNRIVRAYLTKKGRDIRPKVEEQWQKLEDDLLANFTETERLIIPVLLEKLKGNLIG